MQASSAESITELNDLLDFNAVSHNCTKFPYANKLNYFFIGKTVFTSYMSF